MPERFVSDKERALIEKAKQFMPGGSLGNLFGRAIMAEGRGGRIWDISGNEYVDLLLGSGVWYFIAFEIFAVYGAEIRQGGGLVLAPILMLIFGVPHHGATLLRRAA